MYYQTFEPSIELSLFVKCYWILESDYTSITEKQTIVPDGCMEMIFHYGDLYKQYYQNGDSIVQPRCFVIGQLTQPIKIAPTGSTGIFSVRFQPNGFVPFTNIPMKEMEHKIFPVETLFEEEGAALAAQVLSAGSAPERINIVAKFLSGKLIKAENIDRIVQATVETILTANGKISIDEVCKRNNINRRQLVRKFSSTIGLSPKQLSKTVRLQSALKMMLEDDFSSLTALAYENDYFDQAHFIKDFKEFTGCTPKAFYGDSLKMSTLFYGPD